MTRDAGLYIHIPFCDAKCDYCDFVTFVDQHTLIDRYLEALEREMSAYAGISLATIFVGGGTPSVLSVEQIGRLFSSVRRHFALLPGAEVTVEANPESADTPRLAAFRGAGANRISFGFQTADDILLKRIGRLHDRARFEAAYRAARAEGFENINIDLMFGLPGQTIESFGASLSYALDLRPEHLSAYALKVEPNTRLGREGFHADDDLEADMYMMMAERLPLAGYRHYEISNFAMSGCEARHNLRYWKNKETIGVGIAAASFWGGRRFKNSPRLPDYVAFSGAPERDVEPTLGVEAREKEDLMLALRLDEGAPWVPVARWIKPLAEIFLSQGWAILKNDRFCLTPSGWLRSNKLFSELV